MPPRESRFQVRSRVHASKNEEESKLQNGQASKNEAGGKVQGPGGGAGGKVQGHGSGADSKVQEWCIGWYLFCLFATFFVFFQFQAWTINPPYLIGLNPKPTTF